jgi:hypothetical protein
MGSGEQGKVAVLCGKGCRGWGALHFVVGFTACIIGDYSRLTDV